MCHRGPRDASRALGLIVEDTCASQMFSRSAIFLALAQKQ